MSKHAFTAAERWAVFTVHSAKCWLCRKPLDLKTMQVDHIIPENHGLNANDFAAVLVDYQLPSGFDLNSYENWLPACAECNGEKGSMILDPTPRIQMHIQKAREKANRARLAEKDAISERRLNNALHIVEQSVEGDDFNFELIKPIVMKYAIHNPEAAAAMLAQILPPVQEFRSIGLEVDLPAPELRISPYYSVVYADGNIEVVQTPRGTGYRSAAASPHSSFFCGHCGSNGPWNGAICLTCGRMDGGD